LYSSLSAARPLWIDVKKNAASEIAAKLDRSRMFMGSQK
jgi:hypothetical protein